MKTFQTGLGMPQDGVFLDVSDMTNLESIALNGYGSFNTTFGISGIDLTGCTGLKTLKLEEQRLSNLDISTCTSLTTVDIPNNEYLQTIYIGPNLKNLVHLNLTECYRVSVLDLKTCDNLEELIITNLNLNTLDISGLKKITSLVSEYTVQNFKANGCTGLTDIFTGNLGGITNFIDLTGCTNLKNINIANASFLNNLDLGSCYRLSSLVLLYLRTPSINLKNGSLLDYVSISLAQNGKVNICVDEFEPKQLKNLLIQSGGYDSYSLASTFNICTCCKFLPSSTYNTIKGNVRLDLNNNGCDNTDRGLENIPIQIMSNNSDSITRFTALAGAYAHYPYEGNFTITPTAPPHFIITPTSSNVSFDTANSIVKVVNFCVTPKESVNDLEISIIPLTGSSRPGRDASFRLFYKNSGTNILSGNVEFYFENSRMNYISSSLSPLSQSNGLIKWNFNNLSPLQSNSIDITLHLLPPPTNNNGDSVKYMAVVNPILADETPENNTAVLTKIITTAIDPNFKECLQGSRIDITKAGNYLYYQVHFQNVGSDTAFNVVITDPLDEKFDLNTLELVNSSYPCNVSLKGNEVEFFFDDIKLPPQLINDDGSNGFVVYKIKLKAPSSLLNDSIVNSAGIYFDFNLPVATNNVATLFVSSDNPLPVKLNYFTLTKLSSGNQLSWKAECTGSRATFEIEKSIDASHFETVGVVSTDYEKCQLPLHYTDNNLTDGKSFYRLKIIDENGIIFYSKVLLANSGKAGFDIKAVSGNKVFYSSYKQQSINIKLFSYDGKEISEENQSLTSGNGTFKMSTQKLSTGVYILLITNVDGITLTKKFVH
jgi:uncharacterized repeat protein (TIGR01451 family)